MIKKLLILLCLFVVVSAQYALASTQLNLGSFVSEGNIIKKEYTLYISNRENNLSGFRIWTDSGFITEDGRQTLTGERLQVWDQSSSQNLTISSQPVTLFPGKTSEKEVPFVFTSVVHPEDPPGIYETVLHILKLYNSDGLEISSSSPSNQVQLDVHILQKIERWGTINCLTDPIEINNIDYNSRDLSNHSNPGVLEIKANSPWELYGYLIIDEKAARSLSLHYFTKIILQTGADYNILYPEGIILNREPVLLAAGPPTFKENDSSLKLSFNLALKNFSLIPAGRLDLPISFLLRTKP